MMEDAENEAARRAIMFLAKQRGNKDCFDCCLRKVSCVNLSIATFVCSFCGGLLRELGHIIKKISTADFTIQEVEYLNNGGNRKAIDVWRNIPAPELGLQILEFQDISGTKEHLLEKYVRKKWYRSPDNYIAPVEKPKFKIQPRFISEPTDPFFLNTSASSATPARAPAKEALNPDENTGDDDVMFVKSPPRPKKDYAVEKFDTFGFCDKFSRMTMQHTAPQLAADKPLQAVTYSFDSFVPSVDKKAREERNRVKAAAKAAQEADPFPLATPQPDLFLNNSHPTPAPLNPQMYPKAYDSGPAQYQYQNTFQAQPTSTHNSQVLCNPFV